jgi:hypothetical protein
MFLCISVFFCFAQEETTNSEDNGTLPLFSFSGLPVQTSVIGFSALNPTLSTDLLAWSQINSELTRYSDYQTKSFFEVAKPVFQIGLMVGGLGMSIFGLVEIINGSSGGPYLIGAGISVYLAGLVWLILDD